MEDLAVAKSSVALFSAHHDDNYVDDGDDEYDQVGEGEGSVVSSVTDKYGFLAGDVLMLEVGHHHHRHCHHHIIVTLIIFIIIIS